MKKNRNLWYIFLIWAIIIIWLWAGAAYSQSSSNYSLAWSVMDGGGGQRDSANYTLYHSIGQPSGIGASSNSPYTNYAGYYNRNARESVVAGKTQDTDTVQPGETIHYMITATNLFDSAVYFMIQDALDAYVDYVAETFYVNDVKASDDWFSPGLLDYQSEAMDSGETLMLAFDVMVKDVAPLNWVIENTAFITAYANLNDLSSALVSVKTNVVTTKVVPEASTLFLLGTGLLGLFVLVSKYKKSFRQAQGERHN